MAPDPAQREPSCREEWPWDEFDLLLAHMFPAPRTRPRPLWRPAVDVIEEPSGYLVLVELPGVDPEAVKVSVRGRIVTIAGDRSCAQIAGPSRTLVLERCRGPFERRIELPAAVDATRVDAEYKDGVLYLRIVKLGAP